MRRMTAAAMALLMIAGMVSGCGRAPAEEGKLQIVAAIPPEYDWVREILGDQADRAQVTLLLDSGVDLHSYQPTAEDMVTIGSCDLFLYTGGESDAWAEKVLSTTANPERRELRVMELLGDAVKEEETVEGMQEAEDHDHDHGDEAEADEHVWLSLRNARTVCEELGKVLGELDPEYAEEYRENARVYCEKLETLDGEYREMVDSAARGTVLFGDRFPFRYLMDDYGLEYYAAFSGCSAETEASFETIAYLAGKVDELGLPCILTTESPQPGVAETIRANTSTGDQRILVLDSMQGSTGEERYLDVMESNLEVLRQALN